MPHKDPKIQRRYWNQYQNKKRQQKIERGECVRCKNKAEEGKTLCQKHANVVAEYNVRSAKKDSDRHRKWVKRTRRNLRDDVLDHYGRACVCCGEKEDAFLTIDHIAGDGAKHRGAGQNLYRWLRKQGFPLGFRTLCANCNLAMGIHGHCPHGTLPPQSTNHPANPYKRGGKESRLLST